MKIEWVVIWLSDDRAPDDLIVVVAVEGQLAAQQQEHDHAHGPQVRLLTVSLHRQHLVGTRQINKQDGQTSMQSH